MVESHEYNIPAAKAALSILRVYYSTGNRPDDITPRDMRLMASSYTGNMYPSGKNGIDAAISDLTEWLKDKE